VRGERDALVAGSAVQRGLCRDRIRSPPCVMAGQFKKRLRLLIAKPIDRDGARIEFELERADVIGLDDADCALDAARYESAALFTSDICGPSRWAS
jgi:hypothetical protein